MRSLDREMRRGGKTTYCAVLPPLVTHAINNGFHDECEVKPRNHREHTIDNTSHLHHAALDHDRDEECEQHDETAENDPAAAAVADVAEVVDLRDLPAI